MAGRVLYLINSLAPGGAEKGLVTLIEGGAFGGVDLKVAVLAEGGGAWRGRLEALGVSPINLSKADRLTGPALVRAGIALLQLLAAWRPDALVLSLPQANLLGRIVSVASPRLVCSFEHNTHLAKPVYEWGFRLTSHRVDWLLADAEQTAKDARRRLYRSDPKRTFVLPLVSFGRRAPMGRELWRPGDPGPFKIVAAGRLTRSKNHRVLVEACGLLRAAGRPVELVVYGEGDQRPSLEQAIGELGLGGAARLAGHDPEWMNRPADLYLLTSLHEGLSIATLEAMHAGIPVLAARVGGLEDYGEAAELIEPANLSARHLADRIAALMNHPARREALARLGGTLVADRYGRTACEARYDVFNAALRSQLSGG